MQILRRIPYNTGFRNIYKGMIDMLPSSGGIAISSPDEISALAYCVGASMRGFKAMTATSGPGWALMIETLQYALC
jgi:2-oxoglutarate ferredoxin oxidoreductase subunit alpha